MEVLQRGQKQQWKSSLDENLMRTGCNSLWDSVFCCFGNYRSASEEEKLRIIQDKQPDAFSEEEDDSSLESTTDLVQSFRKALYDIASGKPDKDQKIFFAVLSLRFLEMELFPYLKEELDEEISRDDFKTEIQEKVMLLAEHRLKKKAKELSLEDVEEPILNVLHSLFQTIFSSFSLPEQKLSDLAQEVGYNIIVLSGEDEVIYDSFLSDEEANKYKDTIVVRMDTEGNFESIGRLSSTKDGNKKLSRIFVFDDSFIQKLRN